MRISELTDARLGILGFGIEGRSTLAALRRAGHSQSVAVFVDQPPALAAAELPEGIHFESAPEAISESVDVLIRSPGFAPKHPARLAADARGVMQTTAMNLFLNELRAHGLPSIGITGSKGKSTTSTLVSRALNESGIASSLVGNIGAPVLDALEAVIAKRAVPVIELSSYHCADLESGPSIAVLLQLFPEHMDWHGTVEAYYRAKMRIAQQQQPDDKFFFLADNRAFVAGFPIPSRCEAVGTEHGVHWAQGWFWRGSERLFSDECVQIPGQHNKQNICCAIAAASAAGAIPAGMQSALRGFGGLPYRLQDEGYRGGIRWVNDSIATAPEATAAALRAFGATVRTLIFGGFDRGYELGAVLDALPETAVDRVILLPTTGHRLARELLARNAATHVLEVPDLRSAVSSAFEVTPEGSVCLFSPGAPSYGFFRDFEDRGRQFSALIREFEASSSSPVARSTQ
jgi:UDP-N-acetylmuramoyl-L-alanine---L-glutamate ligase